LPCGFFLLFSSPNLIAAADWMSSINLHMVLPYSANLECGSTLKCAASGTLECRTQKVAKKSPSGHHRTTLMGYIFATKACRYRQPENMLNRNISSRTLHNMANFGSLTAEICWRVSGTPANFNRFRVLASLLQRRRSTEANQTWQDVWPSPWLVHYTFSGAVAP